MLFPSLLRFSLYFFVATCIFGLLGMLISQSGNVLLNQILSFSVSLPYLISFYLMASHFAKKYPETPNKSQRWKLSLGALVVFWLYSILAIFISFGLSNESFQFQAEWTSLLIIFGIMILFFNLLLFILGYWFLGKPTQVMHAHFQRRKS